jgi:hypothetical protein
MSKRLLALATIVTVIFAPLASYAQTETVTLAQTKQVSQTAPAPDCSGLTGVQAGFCAGQRQNAQTPTLYTYYTLESQRNTYVLSCRPRHLWSRCPVMAPGQQFTLSVEGSHAVLRAAGASDFKLDLVESHATKRENVVTDDLLAVNAPIRNATVHIKSAPSGAEIVIDNKFYGNTPSDITLPTGEHSVRVTSGGNEWSRSIQITEGEITLNADLSPGHEQTAADTPKPKSVAGVWSEGPLKSLVSPSTCQGQYVIGTPADNVITMDLSSSCDEGVLAHLTGSLRGGPNGFAGEIIRDVAVGPPFPRGAIAQQRLHVELRVSEDLTTIEGTATGDAITRSGGEAGEFAKTLLSSPPGPTGPWRFTLHRVH